MCISFDCDPAQLEMILALIIPFLEKQPKHQPSAALPEALIELPFWLEQNSDLDNHALWNETSQELVLAFVEMMAGFRDQLFFTKGASARLGVRGLKMQYGFSPF